MIPRPLALRRRRGHGQLGSADRGLRVVILTGNEDVEVARATLRDGAFDYLCKPFSIDVLARVVAAAVALPN